MAIEIEKRFSVEAPPEAVWDFLIDPHKVAKCLPGASITEQIDDQTYKGQMTVKVGPVASSYKGTIKFERLDVASRTAELSGRGQDVRGKGGADMRMTSTVTESPGGSSEVSVVSSVNVTGILAQFGRGMIQNVSDQMFQVFTDRMREELVGALGSASGEPHAGGSKAANGSVRATSPAEPDEALDVMALGARAGGRAVVRLLTRPGFWITIFVILFFMYWVFLR